MTIWDAPRFLWDKNKEHFYNFIFINFWVITEYRGFLQSHYYHCYYYSIDNSKSVFYKKYRITGSKMTPIAWDFLTFIKDESMPIGVEITKMKKPKIPVKR